jgi:hypothetical protein
VLFTAIFGTGFRAQIVQGQEQAVHGLEFQIGAWVQAGWNLAPLLVLAAAALWIAQRSTRPRAPGALAATAAGVLVATSTIVKPGTGLNVLVPSEPQLATLAVAGVVWALRTPLRARAALASAALGALLLAQSASLLVDSENPRPFHRPLSSSPGWKVGATRAQMRRLVAAAERCTPGTIYDGPPLVAFIAHRRVPGATCPTRSSSCMRR